MPLADIEEQKLRRRLVYRRLRLDGWSVNHKRVQRIWREEGLQRPLPRKHKRSRPANGSRELLRAEYPQHVWAIDFQFDQTMDGSTLKLLNVVDEFSRVCLAIQVGRRCKAVDVIDTIEELLRQYPAPTHLRMEMALSSLPMLYRSGAREVGRQRHTSRRAHPGGTHSWSHSTAGSGMNSCRRSRPEAIY